MSAAWQQLELPDEPWAPGLVDELVRVLEPGQECPGSEQPFRARHVPVDRQAACPACGARVLVVAAPDGGPGGVYGLHNRGQACS